MLRGEKRFIHFANATIQDHNHLPFGTTTLFSSSYQPTMNPLMLSEILWSWVLSAVVFYVLFQNNIYILCYFG